MGVAGILLTGGASTRMGIPKAQLSLEAGTSFAVGLARLLSETVSTVVECGMGLSGSECVAESEVGSGPARATVDSLRALWYREEISRFLVLGCDYPAMTTSTLSWLLAEAGECSAIVSLDGYRQFLPMVITKRGAAELAFSADEGIRSLAALFDGLSDAVVIQEARIPQSYRRAFQDCDTPADHVRILGRSPSLF